MLLQKRPAEQLIGDQIRGSRLVEMFLEGRAPVHAGEGAAAGLRVQQPAVFIIAVQIQPKLHAVRISIPGGMIQHFCRIRLYPVIRIQKEDILAPGCIQTRVAGSGYAAVGLVDEAKARILGNSLCTQRGAAVLRAIVDENGLEVGQSLRPQ